MSSAKKAVLFDLDGTVLDTIADIAAAVNRALIFFGHPVHTVSEVTSYLGNGSFMLIRRSLPDSASDEECINVRKRFRAEYEADMFSLTKPYDGICELLCELRCSGIKTAVVTNKDDRNAVPMIRRFFGDSVDICHGVRKDGEQKPNPDVTLAVLTELGCTPDEALFVGDGMADLEVARRCGIDFVPVGYGYTDPDRLTTECGKIPVADVCSLRRELFKYFEN